MTKIIDVCELVARLGSNHEPMLIVCQFHID